MAGITYTTGREKPMNAHKAFCKVTASAVIARRCLMHPIAIGLILGFVLAYHATARAETGHATPTAVCTTKAGWARGQAFYAGPATFSIANPCTGSTLHLRIRVPEASEAFRVCRYGSLEFVQQGRQFQPHAWVYADERGEPRTPLAWVQKTFCASDGDRLLPGVTVDTLVTIKPQQGLDFRKPFSVFFDNRRVVDFP
jgi:hypothetical protein